MAFPHFKTIRLRREGRIIFDRVEKLEPVISALDRDRSNSRNNALYDIFTEQISKYKEELKSLQDEIYPNWSMLPSWYYMANRGYCEVNR
jgi:hypothetical protein